jgi:ligand-binding sensor domain-containing protein/signal transduction histidine kinase
VVCPFRLVVCKVRSFLPLGPFIVPPLLLISLCALPPNAAALDSGRTFSQYVHDVWSEENGLPQNSVVGIVQSRSGYLWLATQEGLVRFDGVHFTIFDSRNTPQIKDNYILTLCEGADGSLWFGSSTGLGRLKDGEFTAFSTKDGLPNNTVGWVYSDREGVLWIGTDSGLTSFDGNSFFTRTTKDGLVSDSVLSIYEDKEGRLWIGTAQGLSAFKDGKFTNYSSKNGMPNDFVRATLEDEQGNLWIASDGGLICLKNNSFTLYAVKDGLSNNSVLSVYEDRARNLWIGTDGGGLNRLRDGQFLSYSSKDGLSDDVVYSICEDKEGSLWIGTYWGGLNRLKDSRFVSFTSKDGLPSDIVRSIYPDRDGGVWIATSAGLARLKEGRLTNYTAKDGLANNSVLSVFQDRDAGIWVGTRDGLSLFTGHGFVNYMKKDGLADGTVLSMYQDRDGLLWIGTNAGLSVLEGRELKTFSAGGQLASDAIYAICGGPDGSLWLGTEGGGLKHLKNGVVTTLTTRDGLANDIVMAIDQDQDGNLWIGTVGGLSLYRDGKLTSFTTKNGLYNETVFQILEDRAGGLWLSCDKGVSRVKKQELLDVASGQAASFSCTRYGSADGMKSAECDGGFQPAGCVTGDGRLWFPTIKGVAIMDPAALRINPLPPPIVIEQVLVDNKPVAIAGEARIAPDKQKFEFHFTGLSFLAPGKVSFKYKLEGFDKDWVDAGANREAFYTNIGSGHYVFRVIAANNDGVWNETGASFRFYLEPHFYQTVWFYSMCLAAVALMVLGLHRLRVRQVEARFRAVLAERNRIAREIHDTLAQGFVGISAHLETAARLFSSDPKASIRNLDQARLLVRSSLGEARRSVLDLRHSALEKGDLGAALSDVARSLSPQIPVEVCVKGPVRRLAPATENHLFRIGQEALTNAIRHSDASQVSAEIEFAGGSVRLMVKDDGRGFDVEAQMAHGGGRLGLLGMHERAGQMGGTLIVHSAPGRGAEVTVEVLFDKQPVPEQARTKG